MNQDKITEERVLEAMHIAMDMNNANTGGAWAREFADLAQAYLSKCAEVRELETSVKRYNAERNHYREQYFDAMSREGKLRAEVRELKAAAGFCEEHQPSGHRNCVICSLEKLNSAISEISYILSETNDMHVSEYDVSQDQDAVVTKVRELRDRVLELEGKIMELGGKIICDADKKPIRFGCHIDLAPGEEPDDCVINSGNICDCALANSGMKPEQCEYWREIQNHD